MPKVVKKPNYRTPPPFTGSSFTAATGKDPRETSPELMTKDLAKSGLVPEDVDALPLLVLQEYQEAAYYLPYHDLHGKPLLKGDGFLMVFRLRQTLTLAEEIEGKRGKYEGQSYARIPPQYRGIPYILPQFWKTEGKDLFICEGEKKAAKVMKSLKVPAIGIPGKDNWRNKKGDSRLHPWIVKCIEHVDPERIFLVPDGDLRRPHIGKSYDEIRYAITEVFDGEVIIPEMPTYDDKIDDILVEWERAGLDVTEQFSQLGRRGTFREPLSRLIEDYDLLSTTSGQDRVQVVLCESNYSKLFKHHPSYEGLWYDADRNRPMIEDRLITDVVSRELVEFMQNNLSMGRVSMRSAVPCLIDACKANTRELFLEGIQALEWDGVHRLETMFIDYCGAPDTPLVREVGSKWLAGSVQRLLVPGSPLDYMVIATGPQGIGKSSLPDILWGQGYVTSMLSGVLNQSTSEVVRQAHGALCVNFDELSGLQGVERTKLKGFITARVDEAREMYANFHSSYLRRFMIYGSTNDIADFLPPDSSGHRRYAVIPMAQLKFKKLEDARNQLWAEALFKQSEGIQNLSNIELASEDSQQYVIENQYYNELIEVIERRIINKAVRMNQPVLEFEGEKYWGFGISEL